MNSIPLLSRLGVSGFQAEGVSGRAVRNRGTDFRELTDLLPQTIFETDEQGNLTFANRQAFEAFGYSREEFENGLNAVQLVIPEDRGRALKHFGRMLKGQQPDAIDYTALRKDGSTFHVNMYANPTARGDKVVGVRGIIADITAVRPADVVRHEAIFKATEEKARLEGSSRDRRGLMREGDVPAGVSLGEPRRGIRRRKVKRKADATRHQASSSGRQPCGVVEEAFLTRIMLPGQRLRFSR